MGKKNELSYYTQLNYDVIIRNHDNLFYLVIPELSLVVESEELNNAYEKLEKEKKQFFADMISAKSEDAINEPRSKVIKKNFFSELPIFCIKIMIIFFVCTSLLGVLFIGTLPFANSIVTGIPRKAVISVHAITTKVNAKLTNLTSDQKLKMRMQFRKFLLEAKPFIEDIKTVFVEKNENEKDQIMPLEE